MNKRRLVWSFVVMTMTVCVALHAYALPTVVDNSTGATVQVFDTGGNLNPSTPSPSTGAPWLHGLEVASDGTVFVIAGDRPVGEVQATWTLLRSTGSPIGAATVRASSLGISVFGSRGVDLTEHNGKYYFVGVGIPKLGAAPTAGVWGVTPGSNALTLFGLATQFGANSWSSSGLTFSLDGQTAYVSSDAITAGLWAIDKCDVTIIPPVPPGNPLGDCTAATQIFQGPHDDHVVLPDGRIIIIGDQSKRLFDAITSAMIFDLSTIPGATLVGVGSRGTIDPITGDIYVAYSSGLFTSPNVQILRVFSDFTGGTVFADSIVGGVLDLDFGVSSSGGGRSLYITEVDRITATMQPVGSIYEFAFPGGQVIPEPSTVLLLGVGLLGIVAIVRRRRR